MISFAEQTRPHSNFEKITLLLYRKDVMGMRMFAEEILAFAVTYRPISKRARWGRASYKRT